MKNIAVIGAGMTGLAAAYDLNRQGHRVTIFEAEPQLGGLAQGFKKAGWDWSIERYYHHWFASDRDLKNLVAELGWTQNLIYTRPQTVSYYRGKFYPLDSPLSIFSFPPFNPADAIRFGAATFYLKYLSGWQGLEKTTAHRWLQQAYGPKLYRLVWRPLLAGKFGPYYRQVNMAWMWARIKSRTPSLGTYRGGFQAFIDQWAQVLLDRGVVIHAHTPVERLTLKQSQFHLKTKDQVHPAFDQVLVTLSPQAVSRLVPGLAADYLKHLTALKSLGAHILIVSLKHQLSHDRYYWHNLNKSRRYPFLSLVEHTNFVPARHFNGEHLVYLGDYLLPDDPLFQLGSDKLLEQALPVFKSVNPRFDPGWINDVWYFKTPYAQPVPEINHSRRLPPLTTPIPGLFYAGMSQVYPWDRGTNYAVKLGRHVAALMHGEANR